MHTINRVLGHAGLSPYTAADRLAGVSGYRGAYTLSSRSKSHQRAVHMLRRFFHEPNKRMQKYLAGTVGGALPLQDFT